MVALITVEELGAAPSLAGETLNVAQAEQAIATASAWVEGKTGMAFTERTATITLPSSRLFDMPFPLQPLRDVTAISINGVPVTDFKKTAMGTLFRTTQWATSYLPEDITVTAVYGFAEVPADIKGVVLELAALAYDGDEGVTSESIDDYRVQRGGMLSQMSLDTIARYAGRVTSVPIAR
jgi:hypothetical protein